MCAHTFSSIPTHGWQPEVESTGAISRRLASFSSISLRLPQLLSRIKQPPEEPSENSKSTVGSSKTNKPRAKHRKVVVPALATASVGVLLLGAAGCLAVRSGIPAKLMKRCDWNKRPSDADDDGGGQQHHAGSTSAGTGDTESSPNSEANKAEPPGTPEDSTEGRPTNIFILSPDESIPEATDDGVEIDGADRGVVATWIELDDDESTRDDDASDARCRTDVGSVGSARKGTEQVEKQEASAPECGDVQKQAEEWHAVKTVEPMLAATDSAQPIKVAEVATSKSDDLPAGGGNFRKSDGESGQARNSSIETRLSTVDEKPLGRSVEEPSSDSDSEQRPKLGFRRSTGAAGENIAQRSEASITQDQKATEKGSKNSSSVPTTPSRRRSRTDRVSLKVKPSLPWKQHNQSSESVSPTTPSRRRSLTDRAGVKLKFTLPWKQHKKA